MTVGRSTRRIGRAANLLLGSAVLALSLAACGVDGSAAPARWPAVSARTTSISVVALMAGATEAPATVPGPCRTGTVKATENSSPGEGICLKLGAHLVVQVAVTTQSQSRWSYPSVATDDVLRETLTGTGPGFRASHFLAAGAGTAQVTSYAAPPCFFVRAAPCSLPPYRETLIVRVS